MLKVKGQEVEGRRSKVDVLAWIDALVTVGWFAPVAYVWLAARACQEGLVGPYRHVVGWLLLLAHVVLFGWAALVLVWAWRLLCVHYGVL